MMRTLQGNGGVALLFDQHTHMPDAIYLDFFDRRAATTPSLGMLAWRTKAPVIPVFSVPLEGGRYRLIYEHPVAAPADESPEAIHAFMQCCTDVLEMYVRRHPELWLWMHRRWRDTEPRGMSPGPADDVPPLPAEVDVDVAEP
jgi:KDO2-lipid IV(A) lauroyltransferase